MTPYKPQIATLHSSGELPYPCIIRPARYQGTYSGYQWHAWPVRDSYMIPNEAYGSDPSCGAFWNEQRKADVPMVGKGRTPEEAKDDLIDKLREAGRVLDPQSTSRSKTDVDEVPGLAYYLDKNDARNG